MRQRTALALTALALAIPAAHAETSQAVTSGSAFNPQISLILNGFYYHDDRRGQGAEMIEEAAGILHGVHAEEGHGGQDNGFNLGESELVLAATVDPYLDGRLIAVLADGEAEVEEAWLQTRMLPAGLTVKAGKFRSGIGYQNEQHPHVWDFADQNLAYRALIGDEGLGDAGVQLTWLAPLPIYTLIGTEVLQGGEQERFGALVDEELTADTTTVTDPLPAHRAGPRLATAFVKIAPDLGTEHALQLGLSVARARQAQQLIDEDETTQSGDEYALDGKHDLTGLDVVYKFDSAGEYGQGDIKVAAEYLRLKKTMTVTGADAGAIGAGGNAVAVGDRVTGSQDGYYVSAVYGFAPRWQLGLRYDVGGASNDLTEAGAKTSFGESKRSTLALTFFPSEYSRFRLQVADGKIANEAGGRENLQQVVLQYTLSLGPHGAHKF